MSFLTDALGGAVTGTALSANDMAALSDARENRLVSEQNRELTDAQGLANMVRMNETRAIKDAGRDLSPEELDQKTSDLLFSDPTARNQLFKALTPMISQSELKAHNPDIKGIATFRETQGEDGQKFLTPMVTIDGGLFGEDKVVPLTLAGTASEEDVPLKIPYSAAFAATKNYLSAKGGYTDLNSAMSIVGTAPNPLAAPEGQAQPQSASPLGEYEGRVLEAAKGGHLSALPKEQQEKVQALKEAENQRRVQSAVQAKDKEARKDLAAAQSGRTTTAEEKPSRNDVEAAEVNYTRLKGQLEHMKKRAGFLDSAGAPDQARDAVNSRVTELEAQLSKAEATYQNIRQRDPNNPNRVQDGYELAANATPDDSEGGRIQAAIDKAKSIMVDPDVDANARKAAVEQVKILEAEAQKLMKDGAQGEGTQKEVTVDPSNILDTARMVTEKAVNSGKAPQLQSQNISSATNSKYSPATRAAAFARMSLGMGVAPNQDIIANLLAGDNARGDQRFYIDYRAKMASARAKAQGAKASMVTNNLKRVDKIAQLHAESYGDDGAQRLGFNNAADMEMNFFNSIANSGALLKRAGMPPNIEDLSRNDLSRIEQALEKTLRRNGERIGSLDLYFAEFGGKTLDKTGRIDNSIIPNLMGAHLMLDTARENNPSAYKQVLADMLAKYPNNDPHDMAAIEYLKQQQNQGE